MQDSELPAVQAKRAACLLGRAALRSGGKEWKQACKSATC